MVSIGAIENTKGKRNRNASSKIFRWLSQVPIPMTDPDPYDIYIYADPKLGFLLMVNDPSWVLLMLKNGSIPNPRRES